MKHGSITCECGQTFYVESVNNTVHCIRCVKEHDISGFPEVQQIEQTEEIAFTEELDQNGTEGA